MHQNCSSRHNWSGQESGVLCTVLSYIDCRTVNSCTVGSVRLTQLTIFKVILSPSFRDPSGWDCWMMLNIFTRGCENTTIDSPKIFQQKINIIHLLMNCITYISITIYLALIILLISEEQDAKIWRNVLYLDLLANWLMMICLWYIFSFVAWLYNCQIIVFLRIRRWKWSRDGVTIGIGGM